ncbi:MAG: DedA family protein [Candidatus Chaera renei]|uniref:DedA family protein n=1 Tax=Candidatus Chaera renei TaxID=2506947 RepID=A0A4Q0AJH3_9BACT|nr:MAG: DedA family protein [Candidatus Chaera renei]
MAVVFAESGLLIGFFLPGDSLLFTTGLLAQQGVLGGISVHWLALLLFAAAVLGDNVGYTFGRRVGRRLFKRPDSLLFSHENLTRAEAFYQRYGAKTIMLARFIPVVRTFAPILAGVGKMPYGVFVLFNVAGALLWAVGLTYAGYYAGGWFQSRGIGIDRYLLPIVLLIVALSIAPPLWHLLKDPSRRRQLIRALLKRR